MQREGMQITRRRYAGPINIVVAAGRATLRARMAGVMVALATPSPAYLHDWGALQRTPEHSRAQRIDHKATIFQRVTTKSRASSTS